eukprot:scaffold15464_cov140-Isochrysis_galbana.AAC.3
MARMRQVRCGCAHFIYSASGRRCICAERWVGGVDRWWRSCTGCLHEPCGTQVGSCGSAMAAGHWRTSVRE